MRAIAGRLRRLEERFGPAPERWLTRHLWARLEAARLRCKLPSISAERVAELRGRGIAEILTAGRQRVAMARTGIRNG
jgi:hypothetical protein